MLHKDRFFQELMKWGLKSNPRTYAHVCTQFCVDMNAPSNAASTVKEQRRVSYRTKTLMCARQDRQRAPPPDEKRKRLVLGRLREAWPRCNYISVGRSFFTLDRVIRRNLRGWKAGYATLREPEKLISMVTPCMNEPLQCWTVASVPLADLPIGMTHATRLHIALPATRSSASVVCIVFFFCGDSSLLHS